MAPWSSVTFEDCVHGGEVGTDGDNNHGKTESYEFDNDVSDERRLIFKTAWLRFKGPALGD